MFGSTSAIVCEKIQRWRPISATLYCAFSVRIVGRRTDNLRASFLRMLAVAVDIGHAHHHRLTRSGLWERFLLAGNDHRATAKRKLGSVFSYSQPFYESKRATEPIHGFAHISIRKHWDNNAGRHGSVRFHSFPIRVLLSVTHIFVRTATLVCRGARRETARTD